MKKTTRIIAACFLLALAYNACKVEETAPEPLTPEQQLPRKTQTGKNTFGCLVNGKPYVMCADWITGSSIIGNGPPLRVEYTPDERLFYIRTYDKCSQDSIEQHETLDVLMELDANSNVFWKQILYRNSKFSGLACEPTDFDTLSPANFIQIDKFDENARILAGQFEFDLYTPGCTDTIHLRKGRFDIAF